MAERLAFDIDVHRIGEPVAGMMACRNFEDSIGCVMIAAQDTQGRRTLGYAKRFGNVRTGSNRLDILRHLDEIDFRQPLDLFENGVLDRANLSRNVRQAFVDIGNGMRQRLGRVRARAQALKARPAPACNQPQLFGNIARQRPFAQRIEHSPRVARILQDFRDVGKRLVQRPAARRCGLDARPRPAPPRDEALGLERTKRFTHCKTRHGVALAQVALGRKDIGLIRSAEDFLAQFVGQFLVTRLCGQILSPRLAVVSA